MTTIALKENLIKSISRIDDRELLNALNKIISKTMDTNSKKSKESLKRFTMEEFLARNERAENDIKNGNIFSNDEVFAMFEKLK
ncbi:MAG: hypothetical protein ABI723_10215 [Bacteroidia bacterium]